VVRAQERRRILFGWAAQERAEVGAVDPERPDAAEVAAGRERLAEKDAVDPARRSARDDVDRRGDVRALQELGVRIRLLAATGTDQAPELVDDAVDVDRERDAAVEDEREPDFLPRICDRRRWRRRRLDVERLGDRRSCPDRVPLVKPCSSGRSSCMKP
jgi:hypothetical protein